MDAWEQDILWFVARCKKAGRPAPNEAVREAFAERVAFRLASCVYELPDPLTVARQDTFNDYINLRLYDHL